MACDDIAFTSDYQSVQIEQGSLTDSDYERIVSERIQSCVNLTDEHPIMVFWSSQIAVLTDWITFIHAWRIFFYPYDDSCVIKSLGSTATIFFVEEKWWIRGGGKEESKKSEK